MKKMMPAFLCASLIAAIAGAWANAEENTLRQPVFLLCPHHEHYSAWSLALYVDKADPSKPVKMVLEELTSKNGKDDGYANVVAFQRDPKTPPVQLTSLDARSFGSGSLRIEKDNALNVTVTPDGENLKLGIDMRINVDGHFVVGGSASGQREVVVKYNKALKTWYAYATVLENKAGRNVVGAEPPQITGLAFPVSGTGIYRIAAVLASGETVLLLDK